MSSEMRGNSAFTPQSDRPGNATSNGDERLTHQLRCSINNFEGNVMTNGTDFFVELKRQTMDLQSPRGG